MPRLLFGHFAVVISEVQIISEILADMLHLFRSEEISNVNILEVTLRQVSSALPMI